MCIVNAYEITEIPAIIVSYGHMYSKIPILRPPFGLPKSGPISEVVLISNMIS